MTPEVLFAVGLILIVSLPLAAHLIRNKILDLKRSVDEVSLGVNETLEKVREAKEQVEEAKRNLAYFDPGLLLPILSSIAATATAIKDLDNDTKFQLALSKWRRIATPHFPVSSANEQDLKICLRVFHSIMQTINEPDWTSRFREQMKDLEAGGFLSPSKEGKEDIQKLINFLKPEITERQMTDDYRQFVDILESGLLRSGL
jgi:hypothetical protein